MAILRTSTSEPASGISTKVRPAAPFESSASRDRPVSGSLWHSPAVIAAIALLCLHGALIAVSIPNYRVTIDSAYHVSLARYYGLHGQAWWDHINFGPGGRPNLQGPLMHVAVAVAGRALGGSGRDYITGNAIVAVVQWAAAMGTAAYFAFELGGAWEMLLAVALLSGAACTSASFAVGIPSGWMFIFTAWAIWFFIRQRTWIAGVFTAAAIYTHLGGYATAPLGIIVAGLLTRRWRAIIEVGIISALLTIPYTVHVLRYVSWFSGVHSHSALLFDPMLDVLAIIGAIRLFRHPRRNAFMVAWLCAPAAWAVQDPSRFVLQSGLAGSVAAALFLIDGLRHLSRHRMALYAGAIAAVATLFPLGAPSLAAEIAWDAGFRYPRAIEWERTRVLATDIEHAHLTPTLIAEYNPALCPAIAVFAPITCEKGHWIEVEPKHDPADLLSAEDKAYILPLSPADPALLEASRQGWITIRGGASNATLLTLTHQARLSSADAYVDAIIARNSSWLAAHAVNNSLTLRNWRRMLSAARFGHHQAQLEDQRARAGRIELACLIGAYALEHDGGAASASAHMMRRNARGFGVIASFLSDGLALDFIGQARFVQLKHAFGALSVVARTNPPIGDSAIGATLNRVIATVLVTRGDSFSARPAGSWLPWLTLTNKESNVGAVH
ncbi:MAG: hypothetical protein ACREQ4_07230 [Candidatus Binataceae bacterium]